MNVFIKMKSGTEILNYGRDIIARVANDFSKESKESVISILDVGAGSGADLINCKETVELVGKKAALFGLENYKPNAEELRKKGIETAEINIETESFPYENERFDIVVMNQCLEHTKEIFHIFGEISRVLKPNGICIVGVPNLASLHSRIMLLLGMQPSSIKVFGPHVRGITRKGFKEFAETGGYFTMEKTYGSNFYPFPPTISKVLSKIFPCASVCIFMILRRTKKSGCYSDVLNDVLFETPYLK